MRYLQLFRLEVLHSYYADQRCPDFEIEPMEDTRKLLKNYRCVSKPLTNGLRVFIAVNDDGTAFIPLPETEALVFGFHLRLRNPDFPLFTDLETTSQLAAPLYTNETPAAGGELIPVSQEAWFTEHFVVRQQADREPFSLSGRPLEGLTTTGQFIVEGLGTKPAHKRYDEETRAILVNTLQDAPGTPFTVTYPIAPRLGRGVFADVEINYSLAEGEQLGNANPFTITFQSREARWKYYIVTDKSNGNGLLPSIEDKDGLISFHPEDPAQPPGRAGELVAKQYPDRPCLRVISDGPVRCQQAARRNIQLYLDGQKVIDSLPNPSLQNYCSDIRSGAREHALYQIIQYFTQ